MSHRKIMVLGSQCLVAQIFFSLCCGSVIADTTVTIADAALGSGRLPATMLFDVVRSGDVSNDLIVPYQTVDATAIAPFDYSASASSITMPAGSTYASIAVSIATNTTNASDAAFRVQLLVPNANPVPTFAGQQSHLVESFPETIGVADINGDGRLDLVTANQGGDSFSVLLNGSSSGALAFAAHQPFPTLISPGSATLADMNGDGRVDVVVASNALDSIQVFLNATPQGSSVLQFATPKDIPAGSNPIAVHAADLNGDGRQDVVVANFVSQTVSVLLNTTPAGAATPSFSARFPLAVGSTPAGVAIADINQDGRPDILVMNQYDSTVSVLLNATTSGAAAPNFLPQQVFAVEKYSQGIVAKDFNGDGQPDLAVVSVVTHRVLVKINTTVAGSDSVSFGEQRVFSSGDRPRSVVAEDVDGDGRCDLVIANYGSDTVSILLNRTATGALIPSFAAQQTLVTDDGPQSVLAADLDGDGRLDVATANVDSGTVSVLRNTQTGSLRIGPPATGTIVRDYLFGSGLE